MSVKNPDEHGNNLHSQYLDSSQVPTHKHENVVKLMVVGDAGVGKTCFIFQWAEDAFNSVYMPTVGVDYKDRVVKVGKKDYIVEIWDTAGGERFDTVTSQFYDRMEGILVLFDVSNQKSFDNLEKHLDKIKDNTKDIPKVIVGNKSDIDGHGRVVKRYKAQIFAKERNLHYFETTAKHGRAHIDEAIEDLLSQVMSHRKELLAIKKSLRKMEKRGGRRHRSASRERSATMGDEKSLRPASATRGSEFLSRRKSQTRRMNGHGKKKCVIL